jgi:hypothetical protein
MHIIQPITQALPIATVHACNHHCLSWDKDKAWEQLIPIMASVVWSIFR